MSLFGSIQIAANTLKTNTIALQVVGQNIANANTPGYIREEVIITPAPAQKMGQLTLGLGARVEAVVQKLDVFLEERLRGAMSDRASAEAQQSTYQELEGLIGELNDTDISTQLTNFFSSISEILNQPESVSVRNLAVLQAVTLGQSMNHMASQANDIRADLNDRVIGMADDINRLIEEVRVLNIRIANTEGGDVSGSQAVGLRDQRLEALESLAALVDIRVQEQESGGVVVYSGGSYLVSEGLSRQVGVELDTDRGMAIATINILESDSPLELRSGELYGLYAARDTAVGGFVDRLDDFARTLIYEFNKLYSGGQGLKGYQTLESEFAVDAGNAPLSAAGLEFTPVNGTLQVLVRSTKTGQTKTTDVRIDLNGVGPETTLEDFRQALDDIEGLTAEITAERKLRIAVDGADQEVTFANDTSGVLAALGLHTFFKGRSAQDIGVAAPVRADAALFAASSSGVGPGTGNAVLLADFADRPLAMRSGASLAVLYDRITSEVTQSAAIANAEAEGGQVFEETLRGQKLAISGVSLDEEAVRMISYQRAFQASSRFIATIQELLDLLVAI